MLVAMKLEITRRDVVVPVPVDPRGVDGPTPGQARGRRWRTTSANRFVPTGVSGADTEQRIVEAIAGSPNGAGVTGWAALHWQGAAWFEGRSSSGDPLPVPVAIGDRAAIARRSGVRLCFDWLFDGDIERVDGLPITRAERSVCYAARRARWLEEAVQIIDMALASDLVSVDELRAYAARIAGRPHTRKLNHAIELADENVWSPLEVTMRLRWLARGHRRPLCNAPIFDRQGNHLLTPDLFDPVAGIVGEYNGVIHDLTRVRRRDVNREEICRELDLEQVAMMSTDLKDNSFERRLDAAYRRAAARPLTDSWTLDQPAWWLDTSTVATRRALDRQQRERWLRRSTG